VPFLAERRPAQASLGIWLLDLIPERRARPHAARLPRLGRNRLPPPGCRLHLRHLPAADGVRLCFEHGTALPDLEQLLEGEGRGRFIALASDQSFPAATLERYVTEAIAQRLFRR
jgi:hypothetical protein